MKQKKWEELTVLEQFNLVDCVDWKKFANVEQQTQYVRQVYESLTEEELDSKQDLLAT